MVEYLRGCAERSGQPLRKLPDVRLSCFGVLRIMAWRIFKKRADLTMFLTYLRQLQINKCIIITIGVLVAFPCVAEQLGDPTRPPTMSSAAEGDAQSQADFGPVLQSVTLVPM